MNETRWLCCAVLVVLAMTVPASADTYMLFDDWGGTWYDAEKDTDSNEDNALCWAASASNMLMWTRWGLVDGLTNEDEMLDIYEDHWEDVAGHPHVGIQWWFDGTNSKEGVADWAQIDVSGGGGYYPTETVTDYLFWAGDSDKSMESIETYLRAGYATSVWVGGGGHFITVWGFDFDANTGAYEGVWVTDSDDDKGGPAPRTDELVYYDVTWHAGESLWGLEDYYGSDAWRMGGVTGLAQNPVPEPGSLALVGLVGLGLIWYRRRRDTT